MEQEQKPAGGEPVGQTAPEQTQKSNASRIVLIIVAVIVGLMFLTMLGGCFAYKSLKSKFSQKSGERLVEKVIEKGTGEKVKIDSEDGSVNIKTDDGTFTASNKGNIELSKDFPKDIYVPSDAKITYSVMSPANSEDGSKASFMLMYSTDENISDLAEKYKSEMKNADWKLQTEVSHSGMNLNFKKETRDASIAIFENQDDDKLGKTSVTIIGSEN